jgi:hypothetical protein
MNSFKSPLGDLGVFAFSEQKNFQGRVVPVFTGWMQKYGLLLLRISVGIVLGGALRKE